MMAHPDKVEAVRQLLTERLERGEVRSHDPGILAPVEFWIGTNQRIRIESERFDDHETAEGILPSDALYKAMLGDSFLITTANDIVMEDPFGLI